MFQNQGNWSSIHSCSNIFFPNWFWGHWMFLTWVWRFSLGLHVVAHLWYTCVQSSGPLSWFWRCKEHPCPLSPHLGLWRRLEVPDWGLASCSWFEYGHWSLTHPWSKFWKVVLSQPSDYIQIKIKLPSPSQEPPASSETPNQDSRDMDVLCYFKINIESQNFEYGCIKDNWFLFWSLSQL